MSETVVTFEEIQNSDEIRAYIEMADQTLLAQGYTEHSFAHVTRAARVASDLLHTLGYTQRTCELARIAGFMHDIGNVINRKDHAQSGALMAFRILIKMGMPAREVAQVITAIGNHDEGTAVPVNELAAALILADKSDVRRSRVRNTNIAAFDIHDRVNYAVEQSQLVVDAPKAVISLNLSVDVKTGTVLDYFEIFLQRMLLCRRAANFFQMNFQLVINGNVL